MQAYFTKTGKDRYFSSCSVSSSVAALGSLHAPPVKARREASSRHGSWRKRQSLHRWLFLVKPPEHPSSAPAASARAGECRDAVQNCVSRHRKVQIKAWFYFVSTTKVWKIQEQKVLSAPGPAKWVVLGRKKPTLQKSRLVWADLYPAPWSWLDSWKMLKTLHRKCIRPKGGQMQDLD